MSEDREMKKWARILIAFNWLRLGLNYLGVVIRMLVGLLFVIGFFLFIDELLAFPEALEEYCNRVDCRDTYPIDTDEMFRDADIMWAVLTPILVWFYFSVPLILYLFVVWVFSKLLDLAWSDDEKKEFRNIYNEAIDEYKEIKIKEKESKS